MVVYVGFDSIDSREPKGSHFIYFLPLLSLTAFFQQKKTTTTTYKSKKYDRLQSLLTLPTYLFLILSTLKKIFFFARIYYHID